MWTQDALMPAAIRYLVQSLIFIGVLPYSVYESLGLVFHDSSMPETLGCVKYIYTTTVNIISVIGRKKFT